jgi:hypothetical protein
MTAASPNLSDSGDMPRYVLRDDTGRQLVCYLEEIVPIDGVDYGLLSPVDTPVSLVRLPQAEGEEPEEIVDWQERSPILAVAEAVLQEHDYILVRSAFTLTVTGDFDEGGDEADEEEEIEEGDEIDEEGEEETRDLFEPLIDRPFYVGEEQYDLFVPLEPFLLVAVLEEPEPRVLQAGEEFERVKPLIEAELEQREWGD